MKFQEKYISTSEKSIDKNSKKVVLSDDTYSLAEAIHELIKQIQSARLSQKW